MGDSFHRDHGRRGRGRGACCRLRWSWLRGMLQVTVVVAAGHAAGYGIHFPEYTGIKVVPISSFLNTTLPSLNSLHDVSVPADGLPHKVCPTKT